MGFSSLANMSCRIPDGGRKSPRNGSISGVIIHYNAGVNSYGEATNPNREVSANYWIANDGTLIPNVDEDYRAWTSGAVGYPNGALADNRSITFEVSNEPGWQTSNPMGKISNAAYNTLVKAIGDVFKRYNLGPVNRTTSPTAVGVRVHNDFVDTSCPGPWILGRMGSIIADAEKARQGSTAPAVPGGSTATPTTSLTTVAQQVINGDWGNGADRQARLTRAGHNYAAVQAEVNRLLGISVPVTSAPATDISALADAVMRGDYGNGDERKRRLGSNYSAVQAEVNRRLGLGGGSTSSGGGGGLSISQMAQKAINGDYGNGETRRAALGANYAAVQAEVNRILGY